MSKFRIEYHDPITEEPIEEAMDFEDSATVSAKMWAEDYAYLKAGKGWYRVTELVCACARIKPPAHNGNGYCPVHGHLATR